MGILSGLHGAPAILLLCGLLFAEEAGVPLPFAPGEIVLLGAGLLIAAGGINPFIFVPLAIAACVAGSILGFGWASAVGPRGLHKIAAKIHKEKALEKVEERVRSAGPVGIGTSRLIPGLRIYTTLVAGALRISRRTFLVGMVPTTAAWVVTFVVLGAVVGIPVEHFFNRAAMLAIQGVLLVGMALGAFLAIRHKPASSSSGILNAPRSARLVLAGLIDLAVLASVTTGLTQLSERIIRVNFGPDWLETVVILLLSVMLYFLVARRGAGATMGESLLQTMYISGRDAPLRPAMLMSAARGSLRSPSGELAPAAAVLRALGDASRLEVITHLVEESRTLAELAKVTGAPPAEVQHRIGPLMQAGIVVQDDRQYRVDHEMVKPLLAFLAMGGAHGASPKGADGDGETAARGANRPPGRGSRRRPKASARTAG